MNEVVSETKKSSHRHARVIGEPRDRDLPDVKTSPRIPIELIDPEWLRARPQEPTRYNGTINAKVEDDFERELADDADDEGELGFDEE
jgi:hypothetical protein